MQRHALSIFLLVAAVACGPTEQTQQQPEQTPNAPAGETPGGSGTTTPPANKSNKPAAAPGVQLRAATPSSTRGADLRTTAAPASPALVELSVPSGTELILKLDNSVSSETAEPEQRVRATVIKPIIIDGVVAIPEGAPVIGTVVAAQRSGRVKGVATLAIRFNEVTVAKTPYTINTSRIAREAEATKSEDATKIGVGAGVGTAIGAIAGGKKGAAIGAGIGAGAGTGAVLATRGKEVTIPAGATLRTTIQSPVSITVTKKVS
jgi:hypothetical protein